MENISIHELVSHTMTAMQNRGISPQSAWNDYARSFLPIIKLHEQNGKESFDRDIITKQMREIAARYENGELSLDTYRHRKLGLERLTEFHDTGKLEWSAPRRTSRFILNAYYERILADYVSGEDVHPKVKSDITWVGKKYFSWLIEEGRANLTNVGAKEVQNFMIYCSKHMAGSGLWNVRLYMKRLYRYLAAKRYSSQDYDGLLSFPILRASKLYPPAPHEEVNRTLDIIDRHTPQGKRDYAMILLGTVTGLRAVDIANMKLTDIDWIRGEIKIIQSKNGNSVALPLTEDVGEAIQEYILTARPKTDSKNVFLRVRPPFRHFANGGAIGDVYDYYRKRAGLPRDAFDGKGFHSLRRSLGKNLVTSGAEIELVDQVLGDEDIASTEKYISLDVEHLKECALDFAGIKPKKGVLS